MTQTYTTLIAPDGWRIEYRNGPRGFASVFDDRGNLRGGSFNSPQGLIDWELAWFQREHGDVELPERNER